MEKFLENIQEAERIIRTVDHMTYVTFPLIKDKRLLLKMLIEIKNSVTKTINSILQYEFLMERIILKKNAQTNFETFRYRCAPVYGIDDEEIKMIIELFEIVEKHQSSPMEFTKGDKVVIVSDNSSYRSFTIETIKDFLGLAKNILIKAKNRILKKE